MTWTRAKDAMLSPSSMGTMAASRPRISFSSGCIPAPPSPLRGKGEGRDEEAAGWLPGGGDAPHPGVAGRPMIPALHALAGGGHARCEDGGDPWDIDAQQLLQLGVDLRPVLRLDRLAAGVAEPVVLRVLVAGLA